jgi:hypothetical protein
MTYKTWEQMDIYLRLLQPVYQPAIDCPRDHSREGGNPGPIARSLIATFERMRCFSNEVVFIQLL